MKEKTGKEKWCEEHKKWDICYLNTEEKECPKCKTKCGLFRCSLGGLNCSNCMEFISEKIIPKK